MERNPKRAVKNGTDFKYVAFLFDLTIDIELMSKYQKCVPTLSTNRNAKRKLLFAKYFRVLVVSNHHDKNQ